MYLGSALVLLLFEQLEEHQRLLLGSVALVVVSDQSQFLALLLRYQPSLLFVRKSLILLLTFSFFLRSFRVFSVEYNLRLLSNDCSLADSPSPVLYSDSPLFVRFVVLASLEMLSYWTLRNWSNLLKLFIIYVSN